MGPSRTDWRLQRRSYRLRGESERLSLVLSASYWLARFCGAERSGLRFADSLPCRDLSSPTSIL